MRTKRFPIGERLAVSLTHFIQGLHYSLGIALLLVLLDLLFLRGEEFLLIRSIFRNTAAAVASLAAGSLLAGALLPVLPGRAFALKGAVLGIALSFPAWMFLSGIRSDASGLYAAGKVLMLISWIVFQVLNLTGSSTYTSLSGVRKEMGIAIPVLIGAAVCSVALLTTGGLLS